MLIRKYLMKDYTTVFTIQAMNRKDIEGKFLNDYGWIIYVQADFKVALNKPEDNFVWLRRSPGSDMERWIFVHWIENASPEYLIRFDKNNSRQSYGKILPNKR